MLGGFICPHCKKYTAKGEPKCIHCGVYVGGPVMAATLRTLGGAEYLASKVILGICVLAYVAEITLSAILDSHSEAPSGSFFAPSSQAILMLGANTNLLTGQYWRVLTAAFLHGNLLHIGMNGLGFWDLSRPVEQRHGFSRTVVVFLLTAIVGNVLSLLMRDTPYLGVGASGGLFGFMGIAFGEMLAKRHAAAKGAILRALGYTLVWSMIMPMIDLYAHLGGLFAGIALGFVLQKENRPYLHDRWFFAAGILGLLAAIVLIAATPFIGVLPSP